MLWAVAIVLVGGVLWVLWVDGQIRYYARRDEARPADAIAVFGAAEYDGRPSPVLRARLDHALELYRRGLAPLIITLGGGEAEDLHSEGGVGHDYLLAHGVPESAIIAETESDNTEQSAERLAVIARENGLRTIDVVSDGSHLFRIHAICTQDGLQVYTSPRPVGRTIPASQRFQRLTHEIVSYTAWRLHVH
ncbi:MAG TPA: YdcF family protein [Acidobacteriaceae bacterium]|nr:YdcF family protein [Acidobacteriaceae bacterium]